MISETRAQHNEQRQAERPIKTVYTTRHAMALSSPGPSISIPLTAFMTTVQRPNRVSGGSLVSVRTAMRSIHLFVTSILIRTRRASQSTSYQARTPSLVLPSPSIVRVHRCSSGVSSPTSSFVLRRCRFRGCRISTAKTSEEREPIAGSRVSIVNMVPLKLTDTGWRGSWGASCQNKVGLLGARRGGRLFVSIRARIHIVLQLQHRFRGWKELPSPFIRLTKTR